MAPVPRDPLRPWLFVLAPTLGTGAVVGLCVSTFEGHPILRVALGGLYLALQAGLGGTCLVLALRTQANSAQIHILLGGGGSALLLGHVAGFVGVGEVAFARPIEIGAALFAASLAGSAGSLAYVIAWASALARRGEPANAAAARWGAAAGVILIVGTFLPIGIYSLLYVRSGYHPLGPIANQPWNVLTFHVAWEAVFHWLPAGLCLMMGFLLIQHPHNTRAAVSLGAWATALALASALLQPSYFWFFVLLGSGEIPTNFWDRFLPRLGLEPGNTAVTLAAVFGLAELFRTRVKTAT